MRWLKERGCDRLVNNRLVESYSEAFARYIQCSEAVSSYGLLGKHPTTKAPIASPFVQMMLSFQKQANLLWYEIFPHIAKEYGFSKYVKTTSLATLQGCLDTGGYAVASMAHGYWTSGSGHYVCVWKYDGTYIYANDPASSKRTKQKITDFMKERKCFFCFWK